MATKKSQSGTRMQTDVVEALPICNECQSEGRAEPNSATFRVDTPMHITLDLCDEHFMNYVAMRLGPNTVRQLAVVQRSGGGSSRK